MAKTKAKTKIVEKDKKELELEYYLENKEKMNSGKLLRYVGHFDGLTRLFNNTLDEAWMRVPHGETKVVTTKEVSVEEEITSNGTEN